MSTLDKVHDEMSYPNNEQLATEENSHHSIFHMKNSLSFSFLFSLFFSAGRIALMTNQIDGASIDVHIIEGNLYSRDQKKAFTIRVARISLTRGSKPAKTARGDRGVFNITG